MPILRKDEEKKVTRFQYIFSIGLFVITLLMWLVWDTSTITVLLTGAAALTVIINSYQQKEEKDPKTGFRFRGN
jgi:Mg2+/citrate symporter